MVFTGSLVRMTRDDRSAGPRDAAAFGRFVQKLFSFRRKTLRRALAQDPFIPRTRNALSANP